MLGGCSQGLWSPSEELHALCFVSYEYNAVIFLQCDNPDPSSDDCRLHVLKYLAKAEEVKKDNKAKREKKVCVIEEGVPRRQREERWGSQCGRISQDLGIKEGRRKQKEDNHSDHRENNHRNHRTQQRGPSNEISRSAMSSKSNGVSEKEAHWIPTDPMKAAANFYFIYPTYYRTAKEISKHGKKSITTGDTNSNRTTNTETPNNAQPTPTATPTTIVFDYLQVLAVQYPLPGSSGAPCFDGKNVTEFLTGQVV